MKHTIFLNFFAPIGTYTSTIHSFINMITASSTVKNQTAPAAIAIKRYSTVAIVLHWLLALVIVCIFAVGVYMTDLPISPQRLKLYNYHKWAGICFLALTTLRLVWRLTHRPPELPAPIELAMPNWQSKAYHATHFVMYALFFAVPLIGWAYSSAAGFPVVLFGVLPLPDFMSVDKEFAKVIKEVHGIAAFSLIALAGLHIAAAIKHHFYDNDGLISRMLLTRS
jgi:cytochrome b561